MINFWGILSESDIADYAGTLILPSYMAHLERLPFRFAEQEHNSDGLLPLKLRYTGVGRYEEFFLRPDKHALPMLQNVNPGLEPAQIRLSRTGTIWRWSSDFVVHESSVDFDIETSAPTMRIYFEPEAQTLPTNLSFSFDPRSCYVSVTRKELYLGIEVLRKYFDVWLNFLAGNDAPEEPQDELKSESIAGGFLFQNSRLGGEFILQDDETFADLLRFCGLSKTLEDLGPIVRLDLDDPETEIGDNHFCVRLCSGTS